MKCAQPHVTQRDTGKNLTDAMTHLHGCLVGECDGEDLMRLDLAVLQQIGDASGENASLATASKRNNRRGRVRLTSTLDQGTPLFAHDILQRSVHGRFIGESNALLLIHLHSRRIREDVTLIESRLVLFLYLPGSSDGKADQPHQHYHREHRSWRVRESSTNKGSFWSRHEEKTTAHPIDNKRNTTNEEAIALSEQESLNGERPKLVASQNRWNN